MGASLPHPCSDTTQMPLTPAGALARWRAHFGGLGGRMQARQHPLAAQPMVYKERREGAGHGASRWPALRPGAGRLPKAGVCDLFLLNYVSWLDSPYDVGNSWPSS